MKRRITARSTQREQPKEPSPLIRIGAVAALAQINLFIILIAAIVLGCAGVFLATAWTYGPQVAIQRSRYARFTATADAHITAAWIALDLDQAVIRASRFWRASARATPCIVVRIDPNAAVAWSEPVRRAFCGRPLGFDTGYTLADVREVAPHVPLVWPTDAHGYAVPEIRVSASTRDWLASHAAHTFMHADWPAKTELDWLRLELDQPVDEAVRGWSTQPASVQVVFDPKHPDQPLPAALVAARRSAWANWIVAIVFGAIGLYLWNLGFTLIPTLAGLPVVWRWFVMVLPLLTLPTWIDTFPHFLEPLSAKWTTVVRDMLADVDPIDRLDATDPGGARLADGVRLQWAATDGVYADTFGRVAPERPAKPLDDNAATLALSEAIRRSMDMLTPDDRAAVFAALRRDMRRDLKAAAIVFVSAARERAAASDAAADVSAAKAFLDQWTASPLELDSHDIGFAAKQRLMSAEAHDQ